MSNFVLFQGGTGSMVAKAFTHLVAMGMIKRGETVHVQLCDKDMNNSDTAWSEKLIKIVTDFTKPDNLRPAGNMDKDIFFTQLVYDEFNFTDALGAISTNNKTLKALLIDDMHKSQDALLLDTFFDECQQYSSIDVGFKGGASRGAVIFSYLLENDESIFEKIRNEVEQVGNACRVFVVGSIFGGTGAAMFLKTVEKVKSIDRNKVHVAGALILPYFTFDEKEDCCIRPNRFWSKTMTSLKGYAEVNNLVKKYADDEAGLLDRLYFAVQPNNELHYSTKSVSEGGTTQSRRTDFLEVVAASYIVDFFNAEPADNGCYAMGRPEAPESNCYTLEYGKINNKDKLTLFKMTALRSRMYQMLSFSAVICYIYREWETTDKRNIKKIRWLQRVIKKSVIKNDSDKVASAVESFLPSLFEYCSLFIDFAWDIARNGERSDGGTDEAQCVNNYNLLDREAVESLYNAKSSLVDGREPCNDEDIEKVLNINSYCGIDMGEKSGMGALTQVFEDDEIEKVSDEDTYKKNLYKYCHKLYKFFEL